MPIQVYNTLSREKEEFRPINAERVGFYVCGPTVYDYFHVGNARPLVVFDIIRRYLIYKGYNVRYVMNLTDIDDKIIMRATEKGVSSQHLARTYINAFFEDIQKLGIRPADIYPRATDHIADIIDLIQRLILDEYAYEKGGDVFFDVRKFKTYAALSRKKLDDLHSGIRIAVDKRKNDPLDFVLWKASKPGEPSWGSPWGPGRPGWHIECSSMSMKYLGESFDFHAGGQDLIFPHHENERAQSEAASGKPFARYWLHNGFLDIHGEKMAKSAGNFISARELLKTCTAAAFRLFLSQKHYRSPVEFSNELLQAAVTTSSRLSASISKIHAFAGSYFDSQGSVPVAVTAAQQDYKKAIDKLHQNAVIAMDDDFNTPAAISHIFDLVRVTNKFIADSESEEIDRELVAIGLKYLEDHNSYLGIWGLGDSQVESEKIADVVDAILRIRQDLRQKKHYDAADGIRDELLKSGLTIEDAPEGATWRWSD